LQSHDHDANDNDNNGGENSNVINKFKINVLTNAVCVDILVWAARDEQGEKFGLDIKTLKTKVLKEVERACRKRLFLVHLKKQKWCR
jgi:hypothetical protein